MKCIFASLLGFIAFLAFARSVVIAAEAPLTIHRGALSATWSPEAKQLKLFSKGRCFLQDLQLKFAPGPARIESTSDKLFCEGDSIVIQSIDGRRQSISLFDHLPFAVLRASQENTGKETIDLTTVPIASARLPLAISRNASPETLAVLGTGGLSHPGKRVGSYMWQTIADAETRSGIVAGWITSDRGSGSIFCQRKDDQVEMDAQLDHGHLRVHPGSRVELETLAISYFDDVRLGLEKYADTIAQIYKIKLPPQPSGYCTWYHAGSSNERDIVGQAEVAQKKLVPFGFTFMQIDDGWQDGVSHNGPKRNFTRARPDGPYKSGMKATADMIAAHGMWPGIWFMPFAGTSYDPWFKDHQNFFAQDKEGKPYETAWGGTCMDMTNPATRKYVQDYVSTIAHDWHYRLFKMDGLWTGTATKQQYVNLAYHDDGMGDAVLHDPDMTNIEAYRSGLKLIREAAGSDVFLLGCCAPQNMRSYGGAFGLLDAMRVGPDNGGNNWGSVTRGPSIASRHYFLNGRVWYNDPDVCYVRTSLTLDQARANCSWSCLAGQLFMVSDDFRKLPKERLDILKRVMPAHGQTVRPVDLLDEPIPKIWLVSSNKNGIERYVLGLFNWDTKPWHVDLPLKRLGLSETSEYEGFDFWKKDFLPPVKDRIQLDVSPSSCSIIALRAASDHPQVVSTSRHITQGMTDLVDERWDESARSLEGRSLVVKDDPYELRIALGAKHAHSRVTRVRTTGTDNLHPLIENSTGIVRVTIEPSHSREVQWKLEFSE